MVDMVVHRHDLRPTLARLCRLLTKSPARENGARASMSPAEIAAGAASAAPLA
jgi:acetyl-CoA carboxylase carboxyl transferase subunit beta